MFCKVSFFRYLVDANLNFLKMATLKFFLRTERNIGTIRAYFSVKRGICPKAQTTFVIEKTKWNTKKGCVKDFYVSTEPEAKALQTHLDEIREKVIQKHNKEGNNLPDDWLQNLIDAYLKTNGIHSLSFVAYGQKVLQEYEENKRLSLRNKKPSTSTIATYKSQLKCISKYEESRKTKLYFNSIDQQFYNDFILFMSEKPYSQNTVADVIRLIQHILGHGRRDQLHQNLIDRTPEFKAVTAQTDEFPLTEDEVRAIEKLKFGDTPKEKKLEESRDRFLIGICTAQRRRDYKKFTTDNIDKINKVKVFRLHQHKTTHPVTIPLSPRLEKLLKKYGTNPPLCSDSTFNDHIKKICRRAGITQKVTYRENKGGETIIKTAEKWELMSSHTARRTGATIMYLNGVDIYTIMKILGHSTPDQTVKYIRATEDQIAIHMAKSKIFVF